ncbi:unnamed protein product, partial [Staurois parvus]
PAVVRAGIGGDRHRSSGSLIQCHTQVPPTCAAQQCPHLSDVSQCGLSVLSISTHYQCHLLMPPFSAHQCRLSVLISAASSTHISEGEKLPV